MCIQGFCSFKLYRVSTIDLTNVLGPIRDVRVCGYHDPNAVAVTLLYTKDATSTPLKWQVIEAEVTPSGAFKEAHIKW